MTIGIGLNKAQKESLLDKIGGEFFGSAISDQDTKILADLIRTETVLKVFGRIKADADNMAMALINADLGDESQRHGASVVQGIVRGRISTIEAILDLATEPEEEEVLPNE